MRTILYLCILFSCTCSCNNKKEASSKTITIEGNIQGVPDGKIYLVESRKWKTPIDSTTITNGRFLFITSVSSSPFLAAIHYWDGDNVIRLKYRNHTLGNDSMLYSTDAFYVEPGTTTISGNNSATPYLRILAGRENDLLFKNQFIDFGWIANLDSGNRSAKIELFKESIRQNPFSFFLLESIYRSKEQYSKSELTEIFDLFNTTVRESGEGKQFSEYLAVRPGDNDPFPNLMLPTPDNSLRSVFDTSAKIHMLVFWASWCAPCRKEIPLLKEIEKKYNGTGLQMVSISIDEKKESWLRAVTAEKMNWPQLLVPIEKIDDIQNQFRFITIPLIIFTDNNGNEINRFADYDPDNVVRYETVINKFIK